VTTELSRRQRLTIGALLMALGAGVSLAIHFQPQQLRAPAWVAYAAAGSFALAGAALIAGAYEAKRLVSWLGVLVVAALMTPALWVAFGAGGRECGFSLGFVSGVAPDLFCRIGFGLGALLGLFILVLIIRQALTPWR
jgi:hypothetical protein